MKSSLFNGNYNFSIKILIFSLISLFSLSFCNFLAKMRSSMPNDCELSLMRFPLCGFPCLSLQVPSPLLPFVLPRFFYKCFLWAWCWVWLGGRPRIAASHFPQLNYSFVPVGRPVCHLVCVLFTRVWDQRGMGKMLVAAALLAARWLSIASEQNHVGCKALTPSGKISLISPTWPCQTA